LKQETEELRNHSLTAKTISFQSDHDGILQDFKKTESNSLSFTCSSFNSSSYKPENLLNYDNSTRFRSQNQPNSLVCIELNTKQMILSGYLLRSYIGTSNYNLKSWKLEGPKDNVNWVILDKQIDRNWVTKDWSEVYFPIQTKEHFSYFKITQIGKNIHNNDHFILIYLDSLEQF
jgi:hypothetical protein